MKFLIGHLIFSSILWGLIGYKMWFLPIPTIPNWLAIALPLSFWILFNYCVTLVTFGTPLIKKVTLYRNTLKIRGSKGG